jgi:hypothetical protein
MHLTSLDLFSLQRGRQVARADRVSLKGEKGGFILLTPSFTGIDNNYEDLAGENPVMNRSPAT